MGALALSATTVKDQAIEGTLGRVVYQNNGFLIGALVDGTTVLGNMLEPVIGLDYKLTGEWGEHPKYGRQFKFSRYESLVPKEPQGIARYLVRIAKWIGTATAQNVVDAYGSDALDILKTDPARVAKEIRGITLKRAEEVQATLVKNEANEAVLVDLENMLGNVKGIPKYLAADLLSAYGSDAAKTIGENPYLLTEFHGIGFKLADAVALTNGYPRADPRRQCAAIEYVLSELASRGGHTLASRLEVLALAGGLLGTTPMVGLAYGALHGRLAEAPGDCLALPSIAKAEASIAESVAAILANELSAPIKTDPAGLAPDQVEAVELLGKHRIGILQGPPGSGKTYAFARFVTGLMESGIKNIGFAAPTGKAAQRMTESLQDTVPGAAAQTIHRMLWPTPLPNGTFGFGYNRYNPLEYAAIIIDETSMIDVHLAASLLEAVTPDTYVLFVGDPNQLPSIGPGSVLRDLTAAGVPTANLNTIKRNAGQIVRACHKIKEGELFDWSPRVHIENGDNLRHVNKATGAEIIDAIVRIADEKIRPLGFDIFWDFQAISPTNVKSEVSCKAINEALGNLLNPGPVDPKLGFREGDRVVRTRNAMIDDRELPGYVVNGDMGKVVEIVGKRIIVKFINPDRLIAIPRIEHNLLRAYCMTCHRLQGSDAPVVVIPLHKSYGSFPTREWIYTAISRAKTLCVTVGAQSVGLNMVTRVSARRNTALEVMLSGV